MQTCFRDQRQITNGYQVKLQLVIFASGGRSIKIHLCFGWFGWFRTEIEDEKIVRPLPHASHIK